MPEVLCMGSVYYQVDAIDFPVDENSKFLGKETVGGEYLASTAGSAVTFARLCSSLGMQAVLIGKVGNDDFGQLLPGKIREAGAIPALVVDESPEIQTNLALNFTNRKGHSDMRVVGTANQSLSPSDIESKFREYLPQVKFLYLGGCFKLKSLIASYQDFAQDAHSKGVKVALDHGRTGNHVSNEEMEIMRDLVPFIDYYFPSKDEFLTVWDSKEIGQGLEKVAQVSDGVVVVKDAENGSWSLIDGKLTNVPTFPVQILTSVTAGDSFNTGFIRAQSLGMDITESMKFANATAALKISQKTLPTWEEIKKLVSASAR